MTGGLALTAGLVAILTVSLTPSSASTPEQRYRHQDWTIRAYENAWSRRFEGVGTVPAFSEGKGGRPGEVLMLCVGGRPRLGIRWPRRLEEQHASRQRFLLRFDTGAVEVHEFEPSVVSIPHAVAGGYYVTTSDTLFQRASRAEDLVVSIPAEPQGELRARLRGFAAAAFDMTSLCAGRLP